MKVDLRRWLRYSTRAGAVLVALYLAFLGLLYHEMGQPPEVFGRFMNRFPKPLLSVVPFKVLWNRARAGPLQVGDMAPDFELATADRDATVRLSSFRGQRPVVLIFGSYT
jgi:hypothetical protein